MGNMEKSEKRKLTDTEISELIREKNEKTKNDLKIAAELLQLEVVREAYNGIDGPVLIVKDKEGKEATIGFSDGPRWLATTETIKLPNDVSISIYGHGPWRYKINI